MFPWNHICVVVKFTLSSVISVVFFVFFTCAIALQHVSQADKMDKKPAAHITKYQSDHVGCQRFDQATDRDAEPPLLPGVRGLFYPPETERRGKTTFTLYF